MIQQELPGIPAKPAAVASGFSLFPKHFVMLDELRAVNGVSRSRVVQYLIEQAHKDYTNARGA